MLRSIYVRYPSSAPAPHNRDARRSALLTKRRAGTAGGDPGAAAATEEGGRQTSPLFEASLLATAVFLGTNPVAVKFAVGYNPPMPFGTMGFALGGSEGQ